jgi:hypothetical protein
MRLLPAILPYLLALPFSAARGDKPMLSIALDNGPHSRMLKSELTRDWTKPNVRPTTLRASMDLSIQGRRYERQRRAICGYFTIRYVGEDSVPFPERARLPAIRINRGRWEKVDERAFRFEGRPLATIDWYRKAQIASEDYVEPGLPWWQVFSAPKAPWDTAWEPFYTACAAARYYQRESVDGDLPDKDLAAKWIDLREAWRRYLDAPFVPADEEERLAKLRFAVWCSEPCRDDESYQDTEYVLDQNLARLGYDRQSGQWREGCWERFLRSEFK